MKTGPQKEKVTEAQLLTLWWEVPLLSDPNAGGGGTGCSAHTFPRTGAGVRGRRHGRDPGAEFEEPRIRVTLVRP